MPDFLDKLIGDGTDVLRSRIPSGHRLLHDQVDSMKFHKWVLNCISFLGNDAPDHVQQIKAVYKPHIALMHQAEQIFAILESAVEFIRSKKESLTRDKVENKSPQMFSLEFLHPRLMAKCRDHFYSAKYDDCILNAAKTVEVVAREAAGLSDDEYGVSMMRKIFKPQDPILTYSDNIAEQESVMYLFSGFIGVFKNAHSHKFLEVKDPLAAFEILSFANHLCNLLDKSKRANSSQLSAASGSVHADDSGEPKQST
jgi:uncharacterized protein (TIGR02391 family)